MTAALERVDDELHEEADEPRAWNERTDDVRDHRGEAVPIVDTGPDRADEHDREPAHAGLAKVRIRLEEPAPGRGAHDAQHEAEDSDLRGRDPTSEVLARLADVPIVDLPPAGRRRLRDLTKEV